MGGDGSPVALGFGPALALLVDVAGEVGEGEWCGLRDVYVMGCPCRSCLWFAAGL